MVRLLHWLNQCAKAHPSLFFKRVAYVGAALIGLSFVLTFICGTGTIQSCILIAGIVVWAVGFVLMGGLAGVEKEPWWGS